MIYFFFVKQLNFTVIISPHCFVIKSNEKLTYYFVDAQEVCSGGVVAIVFLSAFHSEIHQNNIAHQNNIKTQKKN